MAKRSLTLFLAGNQVLEKVYRDLLVGWQIHTCINCEKIVALTLTRVLCCELLLGYLVKLGLVGLYHLILVVFHIE